MGYLEPLDDACGAWNFDPGNWRVNRVTFTNKRSWQEDPQNDMVIFLLLCALTNLHKEAKANQPLTTSKIKLSHILSCIR